MSATVRTVVVAATTAVVAGLLVIIGLFVAAQSASADGTMTVSANSITRDSSTGNLVYDISVSATESSAECDHQNCYVQLQGTQVDGGSVGLGFGYIGNAVDGATYIEFGHDFEGTSRTLQISSVTATAYGGGGDVMSSSSVTVSDPYPTPSISFSAAPLTRDAASGNLQYDVTVSAADYGQLDAACPTRYDMCYLSLEATLANGSTTLLSQQSVSGGELATYPFTPEVSGSARVTKIVGIRAYLWDPYETAATLSTSVIPVSDPYPTPTIAIDPAPLTRDSSTGNLNYDIALSASGFGQTDSACPTRYDPCYLYLEATLADGSTSVISSQYVAGGELASYPFSPELSGSARLAKVVGLRAYLSDPYDSGATLSTAVLSVSDPYPTPSVSISSAPLTRDSSGNLDYDFTASSAGYALPGAVCANRYDGCILTVEATTTTGATTVLYNSGVPSGELATYPFSQEISGSARIGQVVGVRAYFWDPYTTPALSTAVVPVTDPYPSPSLALSEPSTSRDATTGNFSYDVTATATGYGEPDAICPDTSSCYMVLQATMDDGSKVLVDERNIPGGTASTSPLVEHFVGTSRIGHVVSLDAYIGNGWSTLPQINSPEATVNDVLPPTTLSVTVNSATRDESQNFGYNVTVDATNYSQPYAVCADREYCYVYLYAELADGSEASLGATQINGGDLATYPLELSLKSYARLTKVVGIRAAIHGYYSALPPASSDVATVTDHYVAPYVLIGAIHIGKETSSGLAYTMETASSGYGDVDSVCPDYGEDCFLRIYGIWANGDTTLLNSEYISESYLATYPEIYDVSGTVPTPNLRAVYAEIFSTTDSGVLISPLYQFAEGGTFPGEYVGGSNPSERICQCSGGDPVNVQTGEFYLPATDDSIPGVGPTLSIARTYSTTNAASDGPFGHGWSTSVSTHLAIKTPGDSGDPLPREVQITQENGSTVLFDENSDQTYSAAARVEATLTHDATSGGWTLLRQGHDSLVFNSDGNFVSESDPNGNTVTYGWSDGHVSSISASGGRLLTLSWSGDHVSQVTDSAGRTVSYTYNDANDLISVTAVDGSTNSYTYDPGHLMLTSTNGDGGVTTNAYDSHDRVATQTDPLGRETDFAYTDGTTTVTEPNGSQTVNTYANGLLLSTTTAAGTSEAATTTHEYDAFGNLISSTDPLGHTSTATYDVAGNQLTSTDALGHTTTSTYNGLDEVTSVSDPLSRETAFTYDGDGNKLSETSPSGRVQHWTYNSDGTVASSEDARGKTTTYAYNSAGDPTSSTDPDDRTKSIGYNSAGFATTATDPAGKVTAMTYDPAGRVLTVTDPNSHTTTKTYDADGNLLTTEDADSHSTSSVYDADGEVASTTDARGKATTYTYTNAGQLATTTNPDSHATTNTYNLLGELTSTEDANSHTTTYTYDADGQKLTTTLPSGNETSTAYDAAGRPTTTTDGKGKVTTTAYDVDGEPISVTDPLGRVTSTSYTDDGQVHVVSLPDASTETYTYNADGQTTEFTSADGKNTTYSYDDAGLLTGKVEPGSMETDYSYNTAGRIHITTNPDGSTLTHSYDNAGQLTAEHSSVTGSTDIIFTYTPAGQRATMTDETGTTTYSYNADGQPTSVENGAGARVGYGYDNAGQMASMVYPGSRTATYTYDPVGQMTSVTGWSSNETDFTWTADGQLATQVDPGAVTETRAYDADDQTTSITDTHSGTALATYRYGYDNAGDITSDGTTDAIGTAADTYDYTANSQLTTVSNGTTSAAYGVTSGGELTADTNGNTLAYNPKQELTSLTPTSGPATGYVYDDNGSRTSSAIAAHDSTPVATTTYGYDAEQNLDAVTLPGATSAAVTYTSNGDGLRQTRTTSGGTTHFTWDVSGALALLLDDGAHTYLYGPSSAPIAQVDDSSGTVQYLHGDLIGSSRLITDTSGSIAGTTEYDPYGNRTNHSGTADSTIGYSGNWTDPTTGLTYLRARDYDPATAQFLVVDRSIDATREPYAYGNDDPVNESDPTGLSSNPVTTWLQYLAPIITPLPGAYSHYLDDLNSTHDSLYSIADSFDPLFHAVNGWYNTGDAIANHCSVNIIAGYAADGLSGTIGTGAIIAGGLAGGAADDVPGAAEPGAGLPNDIVLGHYPEYEDLAKATGADYFHIPSEEYDAMTPDERWGANQAFLDSGIDRGANFRLSNAAVQARVGSTYEQELRYMATRGYLPSDDQMSLVTPKGSAK